MLMLNENQARPTPDIKDNFNYVYKMQIILNKNRPVLILRLSTISPCILLWIFLLIAENLEKHKK